MICEWCSSRFPQNSFSPISFIIHSSSLFHPPFHPIPPPSPSSTLFPCFHCHLHLCSISIHFHPFPSHSFSQPLQSISLLSISIPILSFHSIASFSFTSYFSFDSSLSLVQLYHPPSLSIIHSVFTHSYSHSFISYYLHPIHLISSNLINRVSTMRPLP